MPAPTKIYTLVVTRFTVEGSGFVADMTGVNELAGQGYDVVEMLAIGGGNQPGGFVFLMSRTVTAMSEEADG